MLNQRRRTVRKCLVEGCSTLAAGRGVYCPLHHSEFVSPDSAVAQAVQRLENDEEKRARSSSLHRRRHSALSTTSTSDQFETFLEAIREIASEIDPDKACAKIIRNTCSLLGVDRATLFAVDHDTNELVMGAATKASGVRFPVGVGVAGHVAQTGQMLNISDAYSDPRFNPEFDRKLNYRTRTILCTPVRDFSGEIVAVIQAINKKNGMFFTRQDEVLLDSLAHHTGVTFRNAMLFQQATASEKKVKALLEVVKLLHSDPNVHSLIFTLSQRAHELVEAERCTLYLVDSMREELMVMQGEVDIRFPMTQGLAGHVACTGETLNISDAYEDSRFNQEFDRASGFRTKQMLVMPIANQRGKVVGVLQVINKKNNEDFTHDDVDILASLLSIAGPILHNSRVFQTREKKKEAEKMMHVLNDLRSKVPVAQDIATIEEEDEEEEDDDDEQGSSDEKQGGDTVGDGNITGIGRTSSLSGLQNGPLIGRTTPSSSFSSSGPPPVSSNPIGRRSDSIERAIPPSTATTTIPSTTMAAPPQSSASQSAASNTPSSSDAPTDTNS